jgi:hypothetical protein
VAYQRSDLAPGLWTGETYSVALKIPWQGGAELGARLPLHNWRSTSSYLYFALPLIFMTFGLASGTLGIVSVRIPSSNSASALLASIPSG